MGVEPLLRTLAVWDEASPSQLRILDLKNRVTLGMPHIHEENSTATPMESCTPHCASGRRRSSKAAGRRHGGTADAAWDGTEHAEGAVGTRRGHVGDIQL